jgi:hypothetical protein
MFVSTVLSLHRATVRWVANAFGLGDDPAAHHGRFHLAHRLRAQIHRRDLRHHAPRQPRVLRRWQLWIGRTLS